MKDCSLSPQGDDNLSTMIGVVIILHCSLSPQGDDNVELLDILLEVSGLQLIPARGR